MDEKTIGCFDFLQDEYSTLHELVKKAGYDCEYDIPIETLQSLKNSIFFVAIHNGDTKKLKMLLADFPDNVFIPCVSEQDDSCITDIGYILNTPILTLPTTSNYIRKVLVLAQDSIHQKLFEYDVAKNILNYSLTLEFTTDKIKISKISKFIAKQFKLLGAINSKVHEDEMILSLEEAIVNSLEHGNLELSSSLRPKDILTEDLYEQEKSRRLADPIFGKRKLTLCILSDTKLVSLQILDEGKGFNVCNVKRADAIDVLDVSGKGFELIARSFDIYEYRSQGRELYLAKKR